jgi:O-antigen/teichoic acid export membrane protein
MNLKIFGKNTIIYGIGNISIRAAGFFLIPLYTHALPVKDYGLLATLFLTMQFMVILMSAGMRTSLMRFAREYEDKNMMDKLLGNSLVINLIIGLIIGSIILLFLQPIFRSILHVQDVSTYLVLTLCAALCQTLSFHVLSYFQAQNEAIKFTLTGISAAILLIGANLVLLLIFKMGLIGALVASIITYSAVLSFLFVYVLVKRTGIGLAAFMIPQLLRFGVPLIFSMLGQVLMISSSVYFLSYWEGLEVVAIYSLGYRLAQIVGIVFILPFQQALLPIVFRNIDKPDLKEKIARVFTYYFVSVAILSFVLLVLARFMLPVIAPPEYSPAYLVIILILPAVASTGLIIFGETLLDITKKTYIAGIIVGTGGVLSLFMNWLLIPKMGWYGAVIASNFSCIFTGLMAFMLGRKAFRIPVEWLRSMIALGLFAFFLLLSFLLQKGNNVTFYIGVVVAACFSFVLFKFTKFLNDREKIAIKNGFHWIRVRMLP